MKWFGLIVRLLGVGGLAALMYFNNTLPEEWWRVAIGIAGLASLLPTAIIGIFALVILILAYFAQKYFGKNTLTNDLVKTEWALTERVFLIIGENLTLMIVSILVIPSSYGWVTWGIILFLGTHIVRVWTKWVLAIDRMNFTHGRATKWLIMEKAYMDFHVVRSRKLFLQDLWWILSETGKMMRQINLPPFTFRWVGLRKALLGAISSLLKGMYYPMGGFIGYTVAGLLFSPYHRNLALGTVSGLLVSYCFHQGYKYFMGLKHSYALRQAALGLSLLP